MMKRRNRHLSFLCISSIPAALLSECGSTRISLVISERLVLSLGAKKVPQRNLRSQMEKSPTHHRSQDEKRELAPRCGSSLRQRAFLLPAHGMRDGAFPMRPVPFFSKWAPPSSPGGRGQGVGEMGWVGGGVMPKVSPPRTYEV